MMPGAVDGIDVCRRIKGDARLTHTKVVMLSARGTAADIQRGTEAGADGYLVKPFSPLELMHVVARLAFAEA